MLVLRNKYLPVKIDIGWV